MEVTGNSISEALHSLAPQLDRESRGYHMRRDLHSLYCWTWQAVMMHVIPFLPGGRVVDLGCGTGAWLLNLWQYGRRELIGTDSNAGLVTISRALFSMFSAEAAFHHARDLEIPDGAAQLITAFDWLYGAKMEGSQLTPERFAEHAVGHLAIGGYLAFDWYIDEAERKSSRHYICDGDSVNSSMLSLYLRMTREFNGRKIVLFVYRRDR